MKDIFMKTLISLSIAFLTTLFTSAIFAKDLNLYEQPKDDAKVVSVINSEKGIIPIFTPKDSSWVKVADPKDGNVGWIKSDDLKMNDSSFSFKIINTGSGPQGYQIIQFGHPTLTPQQTQNMFKQIEQYQTTVQKDMQKMMQNLFDNSQKVGFQFPMVIPVIVTPVQSDGKQPAIKSDNTLKK